MIKINNSAGQGNRGPHLPLVVLTDSLKREKYIVSRLWPTEPIDDWLSTYRVLSLSGQFLPVPIIIIVEL